MPLSKLIKRLLLTFYLFILVTGSSKGTHLMGGELTYEYDGGIFGGAFYNIRLIVYRYCDSTAAPAPLDLQMHLGIYINDPTDPSAPLSWYQTESLPLVSSSFVTSAPSNPLCSFLSTACIERGEYLVSVLLPDNPDGYHLMVERCCRNGNIVNITNPGAAGMTFYAYIPTGIVNSTPQISDISVPYICTGDTISIVNNAYDPDGDSLTYTFVTPYNGNSSSSDPMPDPMLNSPYSMPITDISFATGYSQTTIFGAGGYAYIDSNTGLTQYYAPNQGYYVAAIEIREYRNGVLISAIRRDLQFIALTCTPNTIPQFTPSASGSTYNVVEGQTLCFNVSFSDADGDSLFLTAFGPLLDTSIVNPAGIMPLAEGDSTVTSQFCWTPGCGTAQSAPYQFSVTVEDNGCPVKSTSQIFSVYVQPGAVILPTVAVSQVTSGIICQGSSVTFQALPTLGGNNPQYTWFVNGVQSGTNDSLFSPGPLNDGDIVTVMLVSNADCLTNDTAFSAPFVVNIDPTPAPQVTITSNPTTILCPQQICLFTANTMNGGTAPDYQWNINGANAGTNQPAFTAANPSGLMTVYVTLTPSTGCPPVNSNSIVFNIQPWLQPDVTIMASVYDSICPGQPVTFTLSSTGTGGTPQYTWNLNGTNLAQTNDTIVLSSITNGSVIKAGVTSNYPCLSPAFTWSDPLEYFIYPPLSGDVTDGPIEVCSGQPVTLDLAATGGWSSTYVYDWPQIASAQSQTIFYPQYSGYYIGVVDDQCYDAVTDSVYIEVLPVPVTDFTWTPELPNIFEPFVQFTDLSSGAVSWLWNLGEQTVTSEQNPSHEYQAGGIFPVTLVTTNDVGCTDTLKQQLEVENYITAYIPNSFTPNGDGKNDLFGLSGYSTGGYSMSIFNRWGQEFFRSAGAYDKWDGTDSGGKDVPAGTYIYLIKINNDESRKPITGTVTLIR